MTGKKNPDVIGQDGSSLMTAFFMLIVADYMGTFLSLSFALFRSLFFVGGETRPHLSSEYEDKSKLCHGEKKTETTTLAVASYEHHALCDSASRVAER